MKPTILYLLVFFSFSFNMFSQTKTVDSVIQKIEENSIVFEKIFVHTNKTSYSKKDVIWFKVYVANNENKPSLETVLVYVSLFSEDGKLVKTQNVYINNGIGNNQFVLNGEVANGNYFIQAHTNNMLNFGKQNKFLTKVSIGENNQYQVASRATYDIQFFPEGGHFLENVKNTVGVKGLINGKSTDYKGTILNSKDKEVALFSSINLGMSKFRFIYNENESYRAIIQINDTIIEKELPKALKEGVLINKISSDKEVVKFQLLSNKINELDEYVLIFHQNNDVIDYLKVDFKNANKKTYAFKKKNFLNGVNSVTVIKNNQPILERKFFVEGDSSNEFLVERLNKDKDSIVYKLNVKGVKAKSNISISILSSNYNYSSNTDIESAMFLTPYVESYIENPSFYFDKSNLKREAHLDLLLLTQGWTKYIQESFVKKRNAEIVCDFEKGINLKGSLSPVYTNNLGLFTTDNQLITTQFLNNKTNFSFNNLIAYKGDTIKISFIEKEVLRKKPKYVKFDSVQTKKDNLSYITNYKYLKKSKDKESVNVSNPVEVESYRKQDGIYGLETVELETKKKSKEFLERKAFYKKHRKEVFNIGAYSKIEIPKKYIVEEYTLKDFLQKEMLYNFKYSPLGEYVLNGGNLIKMVLDGEEVFPWIGGLPSDIVLNVNMKYIEDISFQPHVSGTIDGLAIFTTEEYRNGISNNFITHVFQEGFDKSKKYYKPLSSINPESVSREIDWKPNLITNANGEVVFKLKDQFLNQDLFLSIQGFSDQGKLISGVYKAQGSKVE